MNSFFILKNQRNQTNKQPFNEEIDQIQQPSQKKPIKPRPLAMKLPGQGKWSLKEQTSYIQFLIAHLETMKKSKLRKQKKIFIKMSKFLRTRIPEQCRSHHQKMMELHGNLDEIIRFFSEQVFPLADKSQTVEKIVVETEVKTEQKPGSETKEISFRGRYAIKIIGVNKFRLQINTNKIGYF